MLRHEKLIAFVAARNLDRARTFYRDTLGLRLVTEDPITLVFDVAGTMLRVAAVQEMTATKYTVIGWQVQDIASTVKTLREAGISFERSTGTAQDETGVWTSPSGARVVWFKDLDGNTLSITQF